MNHFFKILLSAVFGFCLAWILQGNQVQSAPAEYKAIQNPELNTWINTHTTFSAFAIEFLDHQSNVTVQVPSEPHSIPVSHDEDDIHGRFSDLVFVKATGSIFIQGSGHLILHLFQDDAPKNAQVASAGTLDIGGLKVISRIEWGADESLRYDYSNTEVKDQVSTNLSAKETACQKNIEKFSDEYVYDKVIYSENGYNLKWPRQYSKKIQKVVIHHTAESDNSIDIPGESKIRSIYRFHTLTRGWGDIGYNYLIDQDGNIFEGRAGGNMVVGAHVYCNNINTLGISMMGNFMRNQPTKAQLTALTKLLAVLGKKYNLDLSASNQFHGETKPVLLGHRDLGSTACPGDNMYALIPTFRKYFAAAGKGINFSFESTPNSPPTSASSFGAELSGTPTVINMNPISTQNVSIAFKNTGTTNWEKTTWLYAANNSNEALWSDSIIPEKNYVAATLRESSVRTGDIGHFDITLHTGLQDGIHMLEITPIINGERKMNAATVMLAVNTAKSVLDYNFISAEAPKNPAYYGQVREAKVILKNTGTIPWVRSGKFAITLAPLNNSNSNFAAPENPNTLAWLDQDSVAPGESGAFKFDIRTGFTEGIFDIGFVPRIGEKTLMKNVGMKFTVQVKRPNYRAQILYENKELTFTPGETRTVRLGLRNLSDVEWQENQISLKVAQEGGLGFKDDTFYFPDFIPQNEAGYTSIIITAPFKAGSYTAKFQALANGKKFNEARWLDLPINVEEAHLTGKITYLSDPVIKEGLGKAKTVILRVKNTGNIVWRQQNGNALRLEALSVKSQFKHSSWISDTAVAYMDDESVIPGKVATFTFTVQRNSKEAIKESFVLKTKSLGIIEGTQFELSSDGSINPTPTQESSLQTQPKNTNNTSLKDKMQLLRTKKENLINNKKKIEEAKNKKKLEVSTIETTKTQVESTQNTSPTIVKTTTNPSSSNNNNLSSVKNIRILLSFPQESANILSTKSVSKVFVDGKLFAFLQSSDSLWTRKDGNSMIVSVNNEKTRGNIIRVENTTSFLTIYNWDRSTSNKKYNDNIFQGNLEFRVDDGKMIVINDLPFEQYLAGIAEIPESEPIEKRKVMTIVARSYARHYTETENKKFPGKSYDGSDSPAVFQKYMGYGFATRAPNWQQALKDTANEVVTFNGEILRTAYFSCSDGRTKTPEERGWTQGYYKKTKEVFQSVDDSLGIDMDRFNKGQCGHGVGLSGLGTRNMALAGKSYKEILNYYYKGIKIEKK